MPGQRTFAVLLNQSSAKKRWTPADVVSRGLELFTGREPRGSCAAAVNHTSSLRLLLGSLERQEISPSSNDEDFASNGHTGLLKISFPSTLASCLKNSHFWSAHPDDRWPTSHAR